MYFRILTILLFLQTRHTILAQVNLVPNSSFEDTVSCPWTYDEIDFATGWYKPTVGSSDLLHSCSFQIPLNYFGYQSARTGNAYAGLYTYHNIWPDSSYREYISIQLIDTLESGKKYDVEFYLSRSDSSYYATIMGMYLSSDSLFSGSASNLGYIPQLEETSAIIEKSAWVKLSYQYIAAGGEKYLTIGNFRDNSMSDTLNTNDGGDMNNVDYVAAYYFIDDVSIKEDTSTGFLEIPKSKISIFPNPTNGIIHIHGNTQMKVCSLVNILTQQIGIVKYNSKSEIDISENMPGVYLLYLLFNDQIITQKIILIY